MSRRHSSRPSVQAARRHRTSLRRRKATIAGITPVSVELFAGLFRSAGNSAIRRHDARRYRIVEPAPDAISGRGVERCPPVDHGVMKLFEYEAVGRQVALFDRAA